MEEENVHGPLLRIEELTHEEKAIINADFIELCRNRKASGPEEFYQAYIDTLHRWRVMCPHPQPHRLYDGYRKSDVPFSFDEHRWFDCRLCGAAVINR
jgi:hypothetical protein